MNENNRETAAMIEQSLHTPSQSRTRNIQINITRMMANNHETAAYDLILIELLIEIYKKCYMDRYYTEQSNESNNKLDFNACQGVIADA